MIRMSKIANSVCDILCSVLHGEGSLIHRAFSNKSKQLRDAVDGNNESMRRLEILTEEMSVKSNELRSHEMLLSIATDHLDSPVWGKDTDSNFVFMNLACAEKILKTTVDDALSTPGDDYELNPLEFVCMQSDRLVQDTMKTHRFFEHAIFEDGSDLWLDTTKSPWLIDGELVGTVGVGKDITEYIPDDVREGCRESGYIEINVDLMYNVNDIREIVCK